MCPTTEFVFWCLIRDECSFYLTIVRFLDENDRNNVITKEINKVKMVVLKVEPWSENTAQSPTTSDDMEGDKSHEMFGFQDLASDYYQVLRQKDRPAWCRFVRGIVIIILLKTTRNINFYHNCKKYRI